MNNKNPEKIKRKADKDKVIKVRIKELPSSGKELPYWTKWLNLFISLILILITLWTLFEIKTQRIKSSQPELRLFAQPFNMVGRIDNIWSQITPRFNILTYNHSIDSNTISYAIDLKTNKKINQWYTLLDMGNKFNMPIFNIGQGTALDIKVQFEFDTTFFLSFFNKYKNVLNNPDTIFKKDNIIYLINEEDTSFLKEFADPQEFQFIQVHSQSSDTARITLPFVYFQLIALRHQLICNYSSIFLEGKEDIYPELNDIALPFNIPPCFVTLKYFDINGKYYIRKFECKPIVSGYGISYSCNPTLHGITMSVKLIFSNK